MMTPPSFLDVCGGTGKEIKEKCPTCHGTGHEQERHTIDVKVPAGVKTVSKCAGNKLVKQEPMADHMGTYTSFPSRAKQEVST